MQLLSLNPLGDVRFPGESEPLGGEGPFGEIRVIHGLDRFDPAHPLGHGLKITPDGPDLVRRRLNLRGDGVFQPTSHG